MFLITLFSMVKTVKQPKCPPTKKWVKQDFPGGHLVKTLCPQCRGPRIELWSEN